MPITLRNVRPDVAAKLRQLEVGAAAVDRAARDLFPAELRDEAGPGLPRRVAVKTRAYLRPAYQAAHASLAWAARAWPHVMSALRTLRGLVADALMCLSLACGVLIALALVVVCVAPPA
jgi:hypothetical protein